MEPRDAAQLFGNPDYYLGYDSPEAQQHFADGDIKAAIDQVMADAASLTLVNAPNIVLYAPGVSGLNPNVVTDSLRLNEVKK